MLDTIAAVPGVESVGLTDQLLLHDTNTSNVFSDRAPDLRPSNAAASAFMYHISPEYLRAEGTTVLFGHGFTWHDDLNSPPVAIVNSEFARKIFGSVQNAIGGYYKLPARCNAVSAEGPLDRRLRDAERPERGGFRPG